MADLFHRVSIRKYQEKKVEPEKLDYILRASMAAPSACNQQPWEFYIVEDPEILEELSETTPYAKLTAKAPMAIVTAYRKECTAPAYAQIDLSICMENMWLATDEVGLGGVWMGIAPLEDRMEEVEKIPLSSYQRFPISFLTTILGKESPVSVNGLSSTSAFSSVGIAYAD